MGSLNAAGPLLRRPGLDAAIRRFADAGYTRAVICEKLGLKAVTLAHYLKRHGIAVVATPPVRPPERMAALMAGVQAAIDRQRAQMLGGPTASAEGAP